MKKEVNLLMPLSGYTFSKLKEGCGLSEQIFGRGACLDMAYSSARETLVKLKDAGIITRNFKGRKNIITLTKKGKEIQWRMKEVVKILTGGED